MYDTICEVVGCMQPATWKRSVTLDTSKLLEDYLCLAHYEALMARQSSEAAEYEALPPALSSSSDPTPS